MVATVFLHSIENSFGLETCCFEGCSRDVASLCMLRNAKDRSLGIINPVRGEKAGECSDENAAAVVVNCRSQFGYLFTMSDETQVVPSIAIYQLYFLLLPHGLNILTSRT